MQRGDTKRPQLVRQGGPETHHPLRLERRLLQAANAVDDEALYAATPDRVKQPVGKLVQNMLACGIPEKFHVAALLGRSEAEAHPRGLQPQALRRLVTAKQQAGLVSA